MEEMPRAREIPCARKRCSSEREGGDGRERRVVAVEEEGQRELLSPHERSSPSERTFLRERERERKVGKRRIVRSLARREMSSAR